MKTLRYLTSGIGLALAAIVMFAFVHGGVEAQNIPQTSCGNVQTLRGLDYQTNDKGSTCDQQRNTYDTGAILTMTALAPSTVQSPTQISYDGTALQCAVTVTAGTGSFSGLASIQGFDTASGTWFNLITSAAITTVSQVVLVVGPYTAVTNLTVNAPIPRNYRINFVESGASSTLTGTVGCNVMNS